MTTQEIAALLDNYANATLNTMARVRGVSPGKNPKKKDNLQSVLRSVENQMSTELLYEALPQDGKLMLALLRQSGGEITVAELKVAARLAGISDFDGHLYNLMALAFVLYAEPAPYGVHEIWNPRAPKYQWQPNGNTRLRGTPLGMAIASAEVTLPDLATQLEKPDPAPVRKEEQSPSLVLHGLHVVAGRAREMGLPFTAKNELAKPALKKLVKELGSDEKWAHFLCDLAYSAGLVTLEARNLVLHSSAQPFFALSPAAQIQSLLKAWFKLRNSSELALVPEIRLTATPSYLNSYSYYPDDVPSPGQLAQARSFLVGLLKRARVGTEWYSIASFAAIVKEQDTEFLIKRSRGPQADREKYSGIWHVTSHQYDRNGLSKANDWEVVEGGFIREVLRGPLRWLGLVEIGYDEAGAAVAFRPTPLGLGALGLAPLPEDSQDQDDENSRALVVQPNFEIVAYTEPQYLSVLYQLERFADRTSLERVAHYKVTRDSVHRGLQGGLTSTAMLEFLAKNSRNEVPQNIAYSLEDWQQIFNRVHVYRQVTLVEAGSESELDAALKGVPPEAVERLSPLWAMVTGERAGEARKALTALKDASLLDYAVPVREAFTIDEQFNIEVPVDNLDIWLQSRLEQFCDQQPQASKPKATSLRFHMNHESIERARKAGWKPDAILEFLKEAGPLSVPADVELSLRGWGKKIAPVALCPTVALVVEPGLLNDMIQVDELSQFFWLKASDTVVLVREDDVPALRAALEKRGIAASAGLDAQLKAPVKPRKPAPMSSSLPGHRRIDPNTGRRLTAVAPPTGKIARPARYTPAQPEPPLDSNVSKIRDLLETGIDQKLGAEITFTKASRRRPRLVVPLTIETFGKESYLQAWDIQRDDDVEYELNEILEVVLTDEEYDLEDYF